MVRIDNDSFQLKSLGEGMALYEAAPGGSHDFSDGVETRTIAPSAMGPLDYVNDTVTIVDHGFSGGSDCPC